MSSPCLQPFTTDAQNNVLRFVNPNSLSSSPPMLVKRESDRRFSYTDLLSDHPLSSPSNASSTEDYSAGGSTSSSSSSTGGNDYGHLHHPHHTVTAATTGAAAIASSEPLLMDPSISMAMMPSSAAFLQPMYHQHRHSIAAPQPSPFGFYDSGPIPRHHSFSHHPFDEPMFNQLCTSRPALNKENGHASPFYAFPPPPAPGMSSMPHMSSMPTPPSVGNNNNGSTTTTNTATTTTTTTTASSRRGSAAANKSAVKTPRSRGRRVSNVPNNNGARMFTCKADGCGKVFKRSEHLKRHIRSIHTLEKPFECPYQSCNKRFSRSDNLNQHIRIHRHSTSSGNGKETPKPQQRPSQQQQQQQQAQAPSPSTTSSPSSQYSSSSHTIHPLTQSCGANPSTAPSQQPFFVQNYI